MPTDTDQWRDVIETFHGRIFFSINSKLFCNLIIIFKYFLGFYSVYFLYIFLLKAGNIKLNPGPNKNLYYISLACIYHKKESL